MNRRKFMKSVGAAALSFSIIKPELVRGEGAKSKINLGFIGCGRRAQWIADLFIAQGGYNIVAAADYFQDRVDALGDKFGVPADKRFTTLSGYKKVLEQKLDAVVVISPPYFHPQQAKDAVDAGYHVYLAKPIAVDVPGCHSISSSGKKASENKRCFLVDFQSRTDPFFCEAIKRVHNGDIGEFAFGESMYHCDALGIQEPKDLPEGRLRNWFFDKALSGDIITEQNIHTLDIMSWIMNEPPASVVGTGGRKVRTEIGDCWDYFTLVFEYKNNIGISFSSRQFKGHGTAAGIKNRMFGTKGVLETEYGGAVMIRGTNFYAGGKTLGIYKDGAVRNIETFYKNVTEGQFDNPTVAPSVQSNLITIMGRTAGYEGRRVKWDETIKSDVKLKANLKELKA